jgi:transcriptional regulator with XRE-family HTH domain
MRINGPVLTRLRYEHGITQTELAAATGIDRSSICRLESGRRPGTPAQIKKLAEVLGVTVTELCAEAEPEAAA